jgi:hypothetical protein
MELKKGLSLGLAIGLSGCATLHDFRLQAEAYCAEFGFTQGIEEFQACTMLKTTALEQSALKARQSMGMALMLGLQQFGNGLREQALQQRAYWSTHQTQTTHCYTINNTINCSIY